MIFAFALFDLKLRDMKLETRGAADNERGHVTSSLSQLRFFFCLRLLVKIEELHFVVS